MVSPAQRGAPGVRWGSRPGRVMSPFKMIISTNGVHFASAFLDFLHSLPKTNVLGIRVFYGCEQLVKNMF